MQLVAYDPHNKKIDDINNKTSDDRISHDTGYSYFQRNGLTGTVTIYRGGDMWKPEFILVEQSDEKIRIKTIQLEIGGQIIMDFDMNFIKQIFPDMIQIKDNKVIYYLNLDKFNSNEYINMITMSFHEVKIIIKLTDTNNINDIKLYNNYRYLETQPRRDMTQKNHEHIILQHRTKETLVDKNELKWFPVNFNGISNGIFIETTSGIDNIESLIIQLDEQIYRNYDAFEIDYLGHKFNDNLIFIPFTPKTHHLSFDMSTSLNFGRVGKTNINIKGKGPLGLIKFHILRANIFKTEKGMGETLFNLDTEDTKFKNIYDSYIIVNRFDNTNKQK